MYKSVSKKLNTLILIVFVYISVKNILSFNDSDIEIVEEIDNYNSFLLENDFNDEELNNENLNSEKNRFELVKKEENKKEDLNLAYYLDTEVATDIVIDEKNINLSLIPVYETMLFSGIPEPKFRPIPEKPDYIKSVILSLKNKKMLQKNLENFAPKNFLKILQDVKDYIDFDIEENITFHFDNNEKVVEIKVFAKDFRHLNLRKNLNNNFISFYEDAPTTPKVIRNRLKVKNSVSRTLKSSEIPPNIAKEFLQST